MTVSAWTEQQIIGRIEGLAHTFGGVLGGDEALNPRPRLEKPAQSS